MIKYINGNIFDAEVEAIVNPVNCVGVMGKGLAKQVKEKYPGNYKIYERDCEYGIVRIGKMHQYFLGEDKLPNWIINFPTKIHWRDQSYINHIKFGLKDLVKVIKECNIKSIAIPPLGCGCGGLNWNEVKIIIEQELNELTDVKIWIYEPKE